MEGNDDNWKLEKNWNREKTETWNISISAE